MVIGQGWPLKGYFRTHWLPTLDHPIGGGHSGGGVSTAFRPLHPSRKSHGTSITRVRALRSSSVSPVHPWRKPSGASITCERGPRSSAAIPVHPRRKSRWTFVTRQRGCRSSVLSPVQSWRKPSWITGGVHITKIAALNKEGVARYAVL